MRKLVAIFAILIIATSCSMLPKSNKEHMLNQIKKEIHTDQYAFTDELEVGSYDAFKTHTTLNRKGLKGKVDILNFAGVKENSLVVTVSEEGNQRKLTSTLMVNGIAEQAMDEAYDNTFIQNNEAHPYEQLIALLKDTDKTLWNTQMEDLLFDIQGEKLIPLLKSIYKVHGNLYDEFPILENELTKSNAVIQLYCPEGKFTGFSLNFREKEPGTYDVSYRYYHMPYEPFEVKAPKDQ